MSPHREIKRPTNPEELFDAVYIMQIDQREMLTAIGGHPDIPDDKGLCGKVEKHDQEIEGLQKEQGKIKGKLNWILGALFVAGVLGGGGAGLNVLL